MIYENYFKEAVGLLENLISIPAISREEDKRCEFLTNWLEKRGLKVNRILNNLWMTAPGFDKKRPTLLLNSHIDTVKPVDGWIHDPFSPYVKDGKLYGLGSNDAGASLCSLIQIFRILSSKPQKYNLILGISAEEEITGKNGIETLLTALPEINLGIVG